MKTTLKTLYDNTRKALKKSINRVSVSQQEIRRVDLILITLTFVAFVSWILFLTYGYGLLDSLFEVVSAITNSGFTMGITQPALPGLLKLVLVVDMILGKFTVIVLLGLAIWKHHKPKK